ncbi:Sodium/calcium exchanger protein-domain-containing protein [Cryomyces antarcticus]
MFDRNDRASSEPYTVEPKPSHQASSSSRDGQIPMFNHNGHKVTKGIHPDGESGRKGLHPFRFLKICFRSTCTASRYANLLWPVVPAAIAIHFARSDLHLWIFILNFIAMIPAANLIGFAGQELARKLPKVFGIILETTLGSVVEIVLFMVLIRKGETSIPVIKAAILGSILANLLLCLGLCFFVGGLRRHEQEFHEAVSEVGSGLMLVAGMALVVPAAYSTALSGSSTLTVPQAVLDDNILKISRATAIVLLVAYCIYIFFQMRSHHSIYDEVLEGDEHKDEDRHVDLKKDKLTLTECVIALLFALACVSLIAVFLVEQIEFIVGERGISDAFMGLILVPLVEKAAEHLTAVDEAWDNQTNFALSHVLGASIQTALLNTPLVVLVGWGLGHHMDLNFEIFDAIVLILAILVVGNFLRDGKSNYLEGVLCVLVYIIIATAAFFYPNPPHPESTAAASGTAAARLLLAKT